MSAPPEWIEVLARAREFIEQRTIQLYFRADGGNPVAIGTGTLLQLREAKMIVTAAHVLNWARDDQRGIGVFNGQGSFEYISVEAGEFINNDAEDLAVLRLDEESAQAVSTRTFIGYREMIGAADFRHHLCGIVGYPVERTRRKEPGVIEYASYASFMDVASDDATLSNFDASRHFLLANSELVNSDGEPVTSPHLQGMSGCGVWAVIDRRRDVASWSDASIQFVGVETGTYEEGRLIKATRSLSVLNLIFDRWRDLRPRLERITISGDGGPSFEFS